MSRTSLDAIQNVVVYIMLEYGSDSVKVHQTEAEVPGRGKIRRLIFKIQQSSENLLIVGKNGP